MRVLLWRRLGRFLLPELLVFLEREGRLMRCDSGRGAWWIIQTHDESITIHKESRCSRKATRWVGGDTIGLVKWCGYCLRDWLNWLEEAYHWPDDPTEWLYIKLKSKEQVEENAENHHTTWSMITKKEKEENEKANKERIY
jgi:hypothetical protein